MKNLLLLSGFMLLILLSCEEPPVVFVGPQPAGLDVRNSIEMIYRGRFLCDSDSGLVHVQGKVIYKEKVYAFSLSPEEIAEMDNVELLGDQLIVDEFPEPLPARITDSLVYSSLNIKDTLFHIGPGQVLKSYKGHQILNKKISDNKWEVMILTLDTDRDLRFSIAEMPSDLDLLNKITPVKDISTDEKDQYLLAPTYLEFEKILRQRMVFQECDIFRRVSSTLQI